MKKLLVVDNDLLILEFLKDFLTAKGYEVRTADSGLAALDLMKIYVPDVVFVDLIMPNIDGRKLCQVIRKLPELKNVYVVILSAIAVEDRNSCDLLEADACIAKGPLAEMAQHIHEVMEQFEKLARQALKDEIIGVGKYAPRNITRELLAVKKHFELLLGTMSEGILEISAAGRIVYANPAAMMLSKMPAEKLLGAYLKDLFEGADRRRVVELCGSVLQSRRPANSVEPLPLHGAHLMLKILPFEEPEETSAIVIINDVTDQKKLEAEKIKAQKLEFLRNLVGGIAHDFNNILSAIVGNISLALLYLTPRDKIFRFMTEAEKASIVAKELIQQFVHLSGVQPPKINTLPLEPLLRRCADRILDQGPLTIIYQIAGDLRPAKIDAEQIDYVFSCLISNAKEAVGENGELRVSAANCRLATASVLPTWPELGGEFVRVTFADNGVGISKEHLHKIFDPYFSTKERTTQKGMGLGLAVARTIISQHSGHIDVESGAKAGATITIYLPAA